MKLLKEHRESDIAKAFDEVKQYQGLHRTHPKIAQNPIVKAAVLSGVLQATAIDTAEGSTQEFLFTPRGDLQREEAVVLDKARAIIGCVRSGQHFSKGRAIFSPRKILATLRANKKSLREATLISRFNTVRPFPKVPKLEVTEKIKKKCMKGKD